MDDSTSCFIGLSVLTSQAIARVNDYRNKAFASLYGEEPAPLKRPVITLVPTFRTTYCFASGINVGIELVRLDGEPIERRYFKISHMTLIQSGTENDLVFPVSIEGLEREDGNSLTKLISSYRELLTIHGVSLKQTPNPERPYILIKKSVTKAEEKVLRTLLLQSSREVPMYFHAGFPKLHAKYKDGYRELQEDPNT